MRKLPLVIGAATSYAAIYQVSPFIGVPAGIIIALFLLSPFVVLYMAYVILRYGVPSGYTFDEKFYEDSELRTETGREKKVAARTFREVAQLTE